MHIVDTHTHSISDDPERYPIVPLGGVQSEWSKEHPVTTEQLIDHMDRAGVDQAVLVQGSTVYGYDNRYVIDSVAAHPERLIGVCCIDATARDASETLRSLIQDHGLSGVRLFTTGSTLTEVGWIDNEEVRSFWQEATRLNVPVAVQIHRTGIPALVNVLERYPDVRILLDHLSHPSFEGGPPYLHDQALFDLARFQNVWLKFSTPNILNAGVGQSTLKDVFGRTIEAFGVNRLMWGSNFPADWGAGTDDPYTELVELARQELSFFGEEDLKWLFGETARTVYPELAAVNE
jgi:L-fuconolactonase